MAKSEVYSWRVTRETKTELERAARRAKQSMGALLDNIVRQWLDGVHSNSADAAEQVRLHDAAFKCIGALRGGNPYRAEQARTALRARLSARHARRRPH